MDTSVRTATLRDVWETAPRGFTNHGAALRLAREAVRRRRSDRALVYVITDGLPEAFTKDGQDVAGHPEKAMAYAKEQARLLKRERVAGFVMLLLEPKDERYVKAARELESAVGTIARELRYQYLLGYSSTHKSPGEREWRSIRVAVDRPDVRVRARDGYWSK